MRLKAADLVARADRHREAELARLDRLRPRDEAAKRVDDARGDDGAEAQSHDGGDPE
jgi:hypothetical protein